MVLESDYTVSSVRMVRPETEVQGVRSASSASVGGVSCSGHLGAASASGFRSASPRTTAISSSMSYSKSTSAAKSTGKTVGFGSAIQTSSRGTHTLGVGGASLGAGAGGASLGATGASLGADNEYYVKMGGSSSNRTAQAIGCGLTGSGYHAETRPASSSPIGSRSRLLSEASQRQHEETATIVTKVIREDTSNMELRIKELSSITAELQHSLKIIVDQANNDNGFLKDRIESFNVVTTDISQTLGELSQQLNLMREEIHGMTHEVKTCDQRIVSIDKTIESKLVEFRRELDDRDAILEQIRVEMSNREVLMAEQTKQLRELEECRHNLFHAEEAIKLKESELAGMEQTLVTLTQQCESYQSSTTQHTTVITTLEQELEVERRKREEGEHSMSSLQLAIHQLEQTLETERQRFEQRALEYENLQQTIITLETTITTERNNFQSANQELIVIRQAMSELEARLEEERRYKSESERELLHLQQVIETLTRERQTWEEEYHKIKQQSQIDIDSITQMLDRVTLEKNECVELHKRERRKSDQLQESLTNLRMILEQEQRESEEKERKIQSFNRVIKETKDMYIMKESEFEMLKEEIGHYKNLVITKEKELSDLSTVFHNNMNEYKLEVDSLTREIKTHKTEIMEKEFRLSEYREKEKLQQAVAASTETTVTTSSSRNSKAVSSSSYSATSTSAVAAGGGGGGQAAYLRKGGSTSTTTRTTSPCRSPSPTLGYCQTHKSIVSLDSRASVGACTGTGTRGILNIRYADPCTKIYPSKETSLQVTNIYQGKKSNRPIRLCDDKRDA